MAYNYTIGGNNIATEYNKSVFEPHKFGDYLLPADKFNGAPEIFQNYNSIDTDCKWVSAENIPSFKIDGQQVQGIKKGTMPLAGEGHCLFGYSLIDLAKLTVGSDEWRAYENNDFRKCVTLKGNITKKSIDINDYTQLQSIPNNNAYIGIMLVGGGGGAGGLFFADTDPNGLSNDNKICPGKPGGGGGVTTCVLNIAEDLANYTKKDSDGGTYEITDYWFDIWCGFGGKYGKNDFAKYSNKTSKNMTGADGKDGKDTGLYLHCCYTFTSKEGEVHPDEITLLLANGLGGNGGKGGEFSSSYGNFGDGTDTRTPGGGKYNLDKYYMDIEASLSGGTTIYDLLLTLFHNVYYPVASFKGGTASSFNYDFTWGHECGIRPAWNCNYYFTQLTKNNSDEQDYEVTDNIKHNIQNSTYFGDKFGSLDCESVKHTIYGGASIGYIASSNRSSYLSSIVGFGGDATNGTSKVVATTNHHSTTKYYQEKSYGHSGGFYLFY